MSRRSGDGGRPAGVRVRHAGLITRASWTLAGLLVLLLLVLGVRTGMAGRPASIAPLSVPDFPIGSDHAATRLAEAIRIRTVAADERGAAADDPFAMLRDWLSSSYPAFHAATTRTVLGGGTLVFEWTGNDPAQRPIILMAHQDVVPEVAPERWAHPPFSGTVTTSHVWGRGAIDNKGSLVAMLEAAEALVAGGHQPARTIYFVFGHDEETSGSGAAAAAQMLEGRGVRAQFVLDEGSLAVADHPVTGGPVALIGIGEKGYATVRVTARTAGGHSSAPPAQTAVGVLARAVDAIMRRPFPRRYDGATRAMLEALAPEAPLAARVAIANAWLLRRALVAQVGASPQGAAMLQTTLAPTMLSGSVRENVLATEASALINLRIASGDTVQTALAHLRKSVEGLPVTLELVGDSRDPSALSGTDGPGFQVIAGAVKALFDIPVAPAPVIAATDSRSMQGITDEIYRFQPLLLPVADVAMIHGIDERMGVDAFARMIRFYGAVLVEGGGTTAARASPPVAR